MRTACGSHISTRGQTKRPGGRESLSWYSRPGSSRPNCGATLPGLEALIVVITEEDAARLTSLEDFAHIGPAQLRVIWYSTAIGKFEEINEVLPRWWDMIGQDEQISFSDLVDYYTALRALTPTT